MPHKLNQDPYLDILKLLLQDVSEIREQVMQNAQIRMAGFSAYYRDGVFTKSAANLAQYLALRQHDLRHLQLRLSQAGLSSFGHAESSVQSTLDAVLDMLRRATDKNYRPPDKNPSEFGFNRGQQLLEQHCIELFGPYFDNTKAHIMVTLATEAAWDYQPLANLMTKGMTCARINCAHDDALLWQAMIRNIRRAETETGRTCRVLIDLAGHKVRTGPVQLGPAVYHLNTAHDELGRVLGPALLILVRQHGKQGQSQPRSYPPRLGLPSDFFDRLSEGGEIGFTDTRGKPRALLLKKRLSDDEWLAECWQNAFLAAASEMHLMNGSETKTSCRAGTFPGAEQSIKLYQGQTLLLTDAGIEGAPAVLNKAGDIVKPAQIGCTLSSALQRVKIGQPVWLDDGKLGAVVEEITADGVLLRITRARGSGVVLRGDKGINFPETDLGLPPLSDKDKTDLDFVCDHADLVGFSFVESLADMECLMDELARRNATDLPIIAKIETNRAVKNLPEIILGSIGRHSLGIMIARGDLAVELGSARLAEIQEELLWLCEAARVPVIWATQVLESIAKKGVKSRPEFTDAAMAVRAECVMLNKGPYILDALEALRNVMARMHQHQHKKHPRLRALHW